MSKKVIEKKELPSFIEIYDGALPDDICDFLIGTFNRESEMSISAISRESDVEEVRTIIDPAKGTKPVYVGAQHMTLSDTNYLHDSIISELDYIVREKIFDYNDKYMLWSSKLNMDLIPDEEEKIIVEQQSKSVNYINEIIIRHGMWAIKKYTAPDDGYYAWQVKPKKGRMVIWPVGFTHTHKGNNPISNDKYITAAWYKVNNFFK